jgi:hypothetical protein
MLSDSLDTFVKWMEFNVAGILGSGSSLTQLIEAENIPVGPLPNTGGVVHKITPEKAQEVAADILAGCLKYKVAVADVAAQMCQESRFDPEAENPNHQHDDEPGDPLEHDDVGIEQEDIKVAEAEFPGKSTFDIRILLLDLNYGVDYVCRTVAENLTWAQRAFQKDPSLADRVPNGDYRVLGFHAYNHGKNGSLAIALVDGVHGNWTYGLGVAERAQKYREDLK